MKKLKLGLLIAAMTGAMVAFTGCGAKSVDLNEYVKFEYEGYDGYGKASASIDYGALEEEIGGMETDDISFMSAIAVETAVDGELDKTEGLSNGDKVEYQWNISDSDVKTIKEKCKLKLKYKDFTNEVEGLMDPKDFDVADILEIQVNGIAPQGSLTVSSKISGLSAEADKTSGLSNGDEVTITFKPTYMDQTMEDVCSEANIPEFDTIYKYKVEGLHNYVTKSSEIPDNVLQVLKKKAEEKIQSEQDYSCENDDSLFAALYPHKNCDSYKLCAIGISPATDGANRVILVYELKYSVHGEVTSYVALGYTGVMDSDEGLREDDFTPYDYYGRTEVDGKHYWGDPTLEDLKNTVKEMFNSDTDFVYETM